MVGVPDTRPDADIDRPAGSPNAEYVSVCPLAVSLAATCSEAAAPTVDVWLPGLVIVTMFDEAARNGCVNSHPPTPPLKSLPQVDWTANVPVPEVTSAAVPWPEEIQPHRSPFSAPELAVHPPAGNWSVTVSAYSWPPTMVTPSSRPAVPALTKFRPQLAPMSVR